MSEFTMTIDGTGVSSTSTFGVINPASGEVFESAPDCSRPQLDWAMRSAAKAFGDWSTDGRLRRELVAALADQIESSADHLAALLTSEQGKPKAAARDEVLSVVDCFRWFASASFEPEMVADDSASVRVLRRPLGVVAAITPWNYPLILATYKLAPALVAGNTVVLKPSPYTPLSTLRMAELARSILPAGVLNVVSGGDDLGRRMTEHPVPRKISFTGSVATGHKVAEAAAKDLKRVTLELGGNDPAIVLDDADPDEIADGLFWGAFTNTGQICAAIKRLYVPERLFQHVVDALADRARSVKVGDGAEEDTDLGPLNNLPQFERVQELADDATGAGGTPVTGGVALDQPGYFFEPTIFVGVREGVRIVDEEQFGPVLPVMSYRSLDEVLMRANDTHFGLGGSVWSPDIQRASAVASRLDCGTAWINAHPVFGPHLPFAGSKSSGIGVENGALGYCEFTELQVVHAPAQEQTPVGAGR